MAEPLFSDDELAASIPSEIDEGDRFKLLLDIDRVLSPDSPARQQTVWEVGFHWLDRDQALFTLNIEQKRQPVFPGNLPLEGYVTWDAGDLLVAVGDHENGGLTAAIVKGGFPSYSDEADLEEILAEGSWWLELAKVLVRVVHDCPWPTLNSADL